MAGAVGEILVGAAFGVFGRLTVRHGRDSVVILGFVTSMVVFFLFFLLVPKEAPLGETVASQTGFIGKLLCCIFSILYILYVHTATQQRKPVI
jgi:membrane associated rhomboid family serine protease